MEDKAKNKARTEPLRDSEGLPVLAIHEEEAPKDKLVSRGKLEIDLPEPVEVPADPEPEAEPEPIKYDRIGRPEGDLR